MGNNSCITNWVFQSSATQIGEGFILNISGGMVTMNIFITGDATASTCVFEGKDSDGNWYAVKCANLSTLTLATQTVGINETWQADLTAWTSFRVRISAITVSDTKSLSVKGKVVN